jgi:hypothetical protein
MTYSDKLKNPKWQKRRLEVLQRDNFSCKYCQDTLTELHVHHKEYKGEPWDAPSELLETVCKHCHLVLEDIKRDIASKCDVVGVHKEDGAERVLIYAVIFFKEKNIYGMILYGYEDQKLCMEAFLSQRVITKMNDIVFKSTKCQKDLSNQTGKPYEN